MEYRHEWKHEISFADRLILRQRLSAVMNPDPYAVDGKYQIRSLYFDTPSDRILRENLDGVSRREKFRIRFYNGNTSLIHLEKKSKISGLGSKESVLLTKEEAGWIAAKKIEWMESCSDRPLVQELYHKMVSGLLEPKTIVEYTREPFVYGPGNVRVTMDYDIRTGLKSTDFLNPNTATIPAGDPTILLEVKWDAFLPDIIRDAVQLEGRKVTAFSKYARCRIYG